MSRPRKARRLRLPYQQLREERRRVVEDGFGMLAPLVGALGFTPDVVRTDPAQQTTLMVYRVPNSTHAPDLTPIEAPQPFPVEGNDLMLEWLERRLDMTIMLPRLVEALRDEPRVHAALKRLLDHTAA